MGILDFLGLSSGPSPHESTGEAAETLRNITDSLDKMEPEKARYVASFAYTLGRVAHADMEISAEETREMERIVAGMGGLSEEQAILVVQIAKSQNTLFGSVENYTVAQEFNRLASRAQKLSLVNCLFAVSSSDQSISTVEDNEIRKITMELKLDHKDFIEARSAYKEHLEVLKKRG